MMSVQENVIDLAQGDEKSGDDEIIDVEQLQEIEDKLKELEKEGGHPVSIFSVLL
jgi:hypothetical protein